MFRKTKAQADNAEVMPGTSFDTILGAGCRVDGDLTIKGSARLLGEVEGSVKVSGDIEIELGARVRGTVRAERARIGGRIEGDVLVKDSLELRSGAHLSGDVYARSFRIQDGAIFQGQCHMGREWEDGELRQAAGNG